MGQQLHVFLETIRAVYKADFDAAFNNGIPCSDRESRGNITVETGVEQMFKQNKRFCPRNGYTRLNSLKNILKSPQSNRYFVQGKSGFGKTFLTHQLAYDWYHGTDGSPMKEVDILLILRLGRLSPVASIYKIIKTLLLPNEPRIGENDIKSILEKASSVLIIVDEDGGDLRPHVTQGSDVVRILGREMFQEFMVVLLARDLPDDAFFDEKRVRLIGFDSKAQEEYIVNHIMHDEESGDSIKRLMMGSPIVGDLRRIPLVFSLFGHTLHDSDRLHKFASITKLFENVVAGLCQLFKRHLMEEQIESFENFEQNHMALDKVAYGQLQSWKSETEIDKRKLCELLGQDFLDQYLLLGILQEKVNIELVDLDGNSRVKERLTIQFYHQLFCEWYAAHHLASSLAKFQAIDDAVIRMLDDFDPKQVQYLFRFACGLSPKAANRIIEYLKFSVDYEIFAILCLIEQEGNVEKIRASLEEMCGQEVQIHKRDTKLWQRTCIQLLDIASKTYQISILRLLLYEIFYKMDPLSGDIVLLSEVYLKPIDTLQALWIERAGVEFDEETFHAILSFATKCPELKTMSFTSCFLSRALKNGALLERIRRMGMTVMWYPTVVWYRLDVTDETHGKWTYKDSGTVLTEAELDKEYKSWKNLHI